MSMDPKVLVEFEVKERRKETFILMGDLVDHKYNSFAANLLSFNIENKMSTFKNYVKDVMEPDCVLMVREKALEGLDNMISRDTRLADHLGFDVVERIVKILVEDGIISKVVLNHAADILSHANIDTCEAIIVDVIPNILCNAARLPNYASCAVVAALTRLACVSPNYVRAMLDGEVLSLFSHCRMGGTTILDNIAKFMVFVCRTNIISHSERISCVVLLEWILEFHSGNFVHMERACYAIQYLSYERPVDLSELIIYNVVELSCHQDNGVALSALGVLGNIARWGYPPQIQFIGSGTPFVLAIERGLPDRPMKFQWELCLIISKVCDQILTFAPLAKEVFIKHAEELVRETKSAVLCAQDSRRKSMYIGLSEAFKALNKILEFNALLIALKKHPDTCRFAQDLQPVSFSGGNDRDTKMDDLKLLYRTYVTDSLTYRRMEEDKLAALNQLKNIFGLSEKEAESITLDVTSHLYRRELLQCMIIGRLEAAESKPDFLQNLCDKLNFNAQKAVEIDEEIYRQKLNESAKDVWSFSLKQIQNLLCIPEESTSRIHAEFSLKS